MTRSRRITRDEYERRLKAFLAANDGESFTFAKLRGGFYSERNAAGIAMQAAERGLQVSALASYGDWLAVGRQVRKGETALRVLAPTGSHQVPDSDNPEGPTRSRKTFRLAPAFAFEQTDPVEGQPDVDVAELLERAEFEEEVA